MIVSSWRPWLLSFEHRAELDASLLPSESWLARARAELSHDGAAFWEETPESFRFGHKIFDFRRTWLGRITSGTVRIHTSGGRVVISMGASFIPILLWRAGLCLVAIAMGVPWWFIVSVVALMALFDDIGVYRIM